MELNCSSRYDIACFLYVPLSINLTALICVQTRSFLNSTEGQRVELCTEGNIPLPRLRELASLVFKYHLAYLGARPPCGLEII